MVTIYGMRMTLDEAQVYLCHGIHGNIDMASRMAIEELRCAAQNAMARIANANPAEVVG